MPFTQGRALIVGVGQYQYVPAADVAQTSSDAANFANALTNQGGYPANQVALLQDGNATRAALIAALQQLASNAQPGDTVVFFYSGHGDFATDGSFNLTTTDTQLYNGQIKVGTALSQGDFLNLLRQINARQLLIILNSCHSGHLNPSLGFNPDPNAPAPVTLGSGVPDTVTSAALATGSGRVIITACQSNELSWVGSGRLTIFGQTLVQGVDGAAKLPGPYINVNDLYYYLYTAIPPLVQQDADAQKVHAVQEPVLTILQQVGPPLVVAQNPGGASLGFDQYNAGRDTSQLSQPQGNVRMVDPIEAQNQLEKIMNQYNAGRDQNIGNRNVSTGSGTINDYGGVSGDINNWGGVGGSVNTGSGSQTTISTGNISSNQGAVAVGSGISQNVSSGGYTPPPPPNPLLGQIRALRDKVSAAPGISPDDLSYIVGQLNDAIRQLRDNPNADLGPINTALTNAAGGLSDANQADLQRQAQQLISAGN